ncbi:MAG: pilus assembly protein PilM, partial [Thermodesulfovibrionaceae bacterium]
MLLGVEIEFSSVKVAQIVKKYELKNFAYFELPENTVGADGILQIDNFIKTISKIPVYFKQKNPKIAFSISGPVSVAVRILQFPYIDKDEVLINLPHEIDKHIPFSIKDVYYDFHVIETSKQAKTSEVIVVAANKQIVNEYATAFEKAGMIPVVADIGVLALFNTFLVNYREDLVAVMNIGENFTNFFIARNNKPLYFRESINIYKIKPNSSEEEIRVFADEMAAEVYRQIEYFRSEKA